MSEVGTSLTFMVNFKTGVKGRRRLRPTGACAASEGVAGRVPRVSRLMALAIRLEGLVRCGEVENYAELARLGRVTRARLSQIMALLNLAPNIQEELLFLPPTIRGCDAVLERDLRPIAAVVGWDEQRGLWQRSPDR